MRTEEKLNTYLGRMGQGLGSEKCPLLRGLLSSVFINGHYQRLYHYTDQVPHVLAYT